MSLPSMIQAASNSTTAVGCVRAVVVHIVICTYTWLQLCNVKPEPVTFLNNLLLTGLANSWSNAGIFE